MTDEEIINRAVADLEKGGNYFESFFLQSESGRKVAKRLLVWAKVKAIQDILKKQ